MKGGAAHKTARGKGEVQSRNAQGGQTQGHTGPLRPEAVLQQGRCNEKQQQAPSRRHAAGHFQAENQPVPDPLAVPGPEIVAQDGHQGVVDAVDRHNHKGLDFEVDPHGPHRLRGPQVQDLVHAQGHHTVQPLHQGGGGGNGQDLPQHLALNTEVL